jgi:DNA-binding HxlR family transcriptional regulator
VLGCIELVRGAWAPNVVWFLASGPRRFGELRRDISPVSAKVLAARLRVMESQGVVARRELETSPPSVEYNLTAVGAQLVPVVHLLLDVGLNSRVSARSHAASTWKQRQIDNHNPGKDTLIRRAPPEAPASQRARLPASTRGNGGVTWHRSRPM